MQPVKLKSCVLVWHVLGICFLSVRDFTKIQTGQEAGPGTLIGLTLLRVSKDNLGPDLYRFIKDTCYT